MSLPVPTFVDSADDFARVVRPGVTPESAVLEFKKDLHTFTSPAADQRRKGQVEFCRDISSFANTHGGCILIGVDEQRVQGGNRDVAGAVHSLGDPASRIQWMNEAITNFLVPKTFERSMIPVTFDGNVVIAVNIQPSLHLVSVWREDDSIIQCYRRTDHGKVAMNPDDVERHLMDGSRAARLEFARVRGQIRAERDIELVPGVYEWDRHKGVFQPNFPRVFVYRVGEHQFELVFPDDGNRCVAVPYAVLRAAWLTADQRMGIMLSVRLVRNSSDFRLEPVS